MTLWSGRFDTAPDPAAFDFGISFGVDRLLFEDDVTGSLAWWFWLFLHIMYLAGFRNRVSVLVEWAYSYFTYERGARLITGRGAGEASREEPVPGKW